jgi:hypothetical protein
VSLLADAILVVHVLFVAFVVGGLGFIWIGAWRNWSAVRNLRFRIAHLAAIVFVAIEAIVGIACPLTVWEDALRGNGSGGGFIARWLRRLLYYDFPPEVFIVTYVAFALVVLATFLLIPPQRQGDRR